ncbi:hypothetical protein ACFE04_017820 [Oxalis oulophora]
MDSMNSFKGYGKVDPLEEAAFRRKTHKRIIFVVVASIVLVAVVIGVVVGTVTHKHNSSSSSNAVPPPEVTPSISLKAVCGQTLYPDKCYSSISSIDKSNTTDLQVLFELSLHVAIDELAKLKDLPAQLIEKTNDERLSKALFVCESVFDDAWDKLNDSISSMGNGTITNSKIDDMRTWLSASITDEESCLDTLRELNASAINNSTIDQIQKAMQNSTEYTSNSLAIVTKTLSLLAGFNIPIHRKLLGFPDWVSASDRRLLQDNTTARAVTVAADGSGDYKTIGEAIALVPKKGKERFVIHVKEGVYIENVNMDKSKWNVMMTGDGKTKTIISGSLNFIDGTPTFSTATFAVAGKGFIAKDIGFINTAGAEKHQAVAMRSGSDQSVFYRCSFDAFQDTLYAHSNRQFYKECDITGTIDFIFGNAAVVFQDCNIIPRQPMSNQFNTITAQGKKDPNQNTGISIQKCTFSAGGANLTAPTYLGRPWKDFSTTVIMQSEIGSFLNPLGWTAWIANTDPAKTIYYAEYQNSGPGADTSKRVTWTGYKASMTEDEAAKYTVGTFIQGPEWLPAVGVTYQESL